MIALDQDKGPRLAWQMYWLSCSWCLGLNPRETLEHIAALPRCGAPPDDVFCLEYLSLARATHSCMCNGSSTAHSWSHQRPPRRARTCEDQYRQRLQISCKRQHCLTHTCQHKETHGPLCGSLILTAAPLLGHSQAHSPSNICRSHHMSTRVI